MYSKGLIKFRSSHSTWIATRKQWRYFFYLFLFLFFKTVVAEEILWNTLETDSDNDESHLYNYNDIIFAP